MKKISTVLVAFILVFAMAAPAMAKKVKVPRNICWSYDSGVAIKYIAIALKKQNKITFMDGKTDFYAVQGAQYMDELWTPASGSAYITIPDTTQIGVHLTSGGFSAYTFDIVWVLDIKSGSLNLWGQNNGSRVFDLTEIDCKSLDPT